MLIYKCISSLLIDELNTSIENLIKTLKLHI